MPKSDSLIPVESITSRIFLIRGQKVMLDSDLAELYGVTTSALNQAVKRNTDRFPPDFMFQMTDPEFSNLKSQFVTSSWGGRRKLPLVFTEQGVSMLSSVLHSERAIQVNIAIMRAFVQIREMLSTHKELAYKLEELERKVGIHDQTIVQLIEAIRQLMEPPAEKRKKIGFTAAGKK
ncbi:ORF6N domain-containing protein [Leptospirillum ferriphilum]|jgi:hypothetical protein|uniref:KilA-N DNA-binding domain-containing protein n=1 Tax=Leptospirillum sp. Group II '5-way CG' TaxID=419541 RepID=B6AP36_9BACT|nr:MAG: Conserved hypothetical protein [Leptospirillum sp. Group II '5-way CG']